MYLGKAIDTGRAKMWRDARQVFELHPWTGIGTAAGESWTRRLENGETITLSVHNYYYAVLHEAGILGLSIVVFYILLIASILSLGTESGVMASGIAFLVAVLVHQSVEVSLTTGSFILGIGMWSFLGAAISLSRKAPSVKISEKYV